MKKSISLIATASALMFFILPVMGAVDVKLASVDFATEDGECVWSPEEVVLESWGATTAGGNYGGRQGDSCVVWEAGEYASETAILTFPKIEGSVRSVTIHHLDGIADDSFKIYVMHPRGDWIEIADYKDVEPINDTEEWHVNLYEFVDSQDKGFSLGGGKDITLKFEATGKGWTSRDYYGQLAINSIEFYGNGKDK